MISRRMWKRYGTTLCVVGLTTFLLVFWYRSSIRSAIVDLRSGVRKMPEKDTALKLTSHKKKETIPLAKNKVPPISKKSVVFRKAPEYANECPYDMESGVFTDGDKIYDTLHLSNEKIYSEKFTSPVVPEKPVFDNPAIRLNPDRFLLPIVIRGPNNQLIGFRESVYVAIRLNRTLVIPRFIKHRTDSQKKEGNYIHPAHRVDFFAVCRFVSCITLRQFREGCGNQADVVLRLRHYSRKQIAEMESSTGIRFSKSASKKKNINYVPSPPADNKETYFGPNKKEITKLFNTEERCAIYANPFYNLKIKVKSGRRRISSQTDLATSSDTDLFSEIIRRTPAPKYIRNIAEEFVRTILRGKKFVSVHWRYDKDWMRRCKGLDDKSKRKVLCKGAALIQPSDVAQAILRKIEMMKRSAGDVTSVYIASPPSEAEFISGIAKVLNHNKLSVHSLKDLKNFIDTSYKACGFFLPHMDDVESTIEMQICSKGVIFLRSTRSSWSSNVIDSRRIDYVSGTFPAKDEDILLLTNQMREKRERNSKEKKA